jgi:hypothetical protein
VKTPVIRQIIQIQGEFTFQHNLQSVK